MRHRKGDGDPFWDVMNELGYTMADIEPQPSNDEPDCIHIEVNQYGLFNRSVINF